MVKRVLFTILGLLLFGAMANVLIAWACTWYVLPSRNMNGTAAHFESGPALAQGWMVYRWEEFGTTRIIGGNDRDEVRTTTSTAEVLPLWSEFEAMATRIGDSLVGKQVPRQGAFPSRPAVPGGIIEDARGWPMRSMRCWWDCGNTAQTEANTDEYLRAGILLEPYVPARPRSYSLDDQRALPLQPIAVGFMANTMAYALALFLLFSFVLWTKRTFRRLRGCCRKCGYPVGTSPVCTECGAPIPAELRAQAISTHNV
jgi:hypothetical protein